MQVGQVITAGQALASLTQSSLPQNIILAQSDLITTQRQLDDLQTSRTAAEQALQNLNASQQAVYDAESALVRFDQTTYKNDLDRAQKDVVDKKDTLDQAQKDFDPYKDWDPTNSTRKSFEQRLKDAQITYDQAVRKVNVLELQHQTAQANLDAARADPTLEQLALAQAQVDVAQSAVEIIQAQMNKEAIEFDLAHFDELELDAELRAGQHFLHHPFHLQHFFLGHPGP